LLNFSFAVQEIELDFVLICLGSLLVLRAKLSLCIDVNRAVYLFL
jgi:hypothetical protein